MSLMFSLARRAHLALLLAACSCGDSLGPDFLERVRLSHARQLWSQSAIDFYEYEIANQCFCAYGGMPVRIVVRDGSIQSLTLVSTGAQVPPQFAGAYHSIDGLFAVIDDALRRKAVRLDAAYDDRFGYPTSVSIDYIANAIDEEFSFVVQSFSPLG